MLEGEVLLVGGESGVKPTTKFDHWFKKYKASSYSFLVFLAVLVGLAGGFGSLVFYHLIRFFTSLSFERAGEILSFLGPYYVLVPPVLGGLLVGPMIWRWAREAKGHGVPEVMQAVVRRGGRIRAPVPVVKALASSITIGTGGSAGREGPIVQISAGIGSVIGQISRLSDEKITTLVGCGAAAGIAATFNAPISGVIFAMEVVLGEFSLSTFSLIVVSSVTASTVARIYLGAAPALQVPGYELVSPQELLFYGLLGLLAGLIARLYVRTLYLAEDLFERFKTIPEYVQPALGGLLFGLVGRFVPLSFGPGYTAIEGALFNELPFALLASLIFIKILTTSLTLGSGGSGGVFAPGLFIGAMTGGTFGRIVHYLYPAITASPGAYALVGMSAVFAASAHAPITGILILFEMTQDYRTILPLMISTVIATVLSHYLSEANIYTTKLLRRGIDIRAGRDVNIMKSCKVGMVMTNDVTVVRKNMTVGDVIRLMQKTRHNGFPVVDGMGRLVGIITLSDIRDIPVDKRMEAVVEEAMTPDPVVVTPYDTLDEASRWLSIADVGRLPVVDGDLLVGVITRSDIIRAYERKLLDNENREPGETAATRGRHPGTSSLQSTSWSE